MRERSDKVQAGLRWLLDQKPGLKAENAVRYAIRRINELEDVNQTLRARVHLAEAELEAHHG